MEFRFNAFGHQLRLQRDASPPSLLHAPEPESSGGSYREVWAKLAKTSEAAETQYKEWKSRDPRPQIQSGLLNLADLIDYVVVTGMIYPFYPAEELLRPASYAFRLMGPCLHWSPDGTEHFQDVGFRDRFTLKKDSIAFVTLEPELRIPDFIAVRFNLRVQHVYRGLLLGTGPMIDPGFEGRLSIPLHNLTTRDYHFSGGEPLVFAEFTKLTPHPAWSESSDGEAAFVDARTASRTSSTAGSTELQRRWRDVRDYVDAAGHGEPVQSSIPLNLYTATNAARKAGQRATIGYFAAMIAIVLALIPIAFAFFQTWTWLADHRDQDRSDRQEITERLDSLEQRIEATRMPSDSARLVGR